MKEGNHQIPDRRPPGILVAAVLLLLQNETGLAVVLGHEVAHALADHGNERMSEALVTNMGGMALSVALSTQAPQTQQLFMTVFGVGANLGFLLPYSRLHESEADRIGLTLMARAGYDPRAAIPFWERMGKQEGKSRPPEFLSTHPASETRIADIKKYIPEACHTIKLHHSSDRWYEDGIERVKLGASP